MVQKQVVIMKPEEISMAEDRIVLPCNSPVIWDVVETYFDVEKMLKDT